MLLRVCKHFPVVIVFLGYWANILTPYKGRKIGRKRLKINSGIDNFNNTNKIKQSILIILKHNKHSSVIGEEKMLERDRKNG